MQRLVERKASVHARVVTPSCYNCCAHPFRIRSTFVHVALGCAPGSFTARRGCSCCRDATPRVYLHMRIKEISRIVIGRRVEYLEFTYLLQSTPVCGYEKKNRHALISQLMTVYQNCDVNFTRTCTYSARDKPTSVRLTTRHIEERHPVVKVRGGG